MHSQQNPPIPLVARDPISHGIPVQHTDEAASEETQHLRRRCYNCHTTEPPSWRRSTLTPGKIICNKCGHYERTHLRPRPLRFDELRVRGESRKQGKVASPKPLHPGSITIMKGETEPISRSISLSPGSSVEGGSSDWDDSVSVYSSDSGPQSSFNSPAVPAYPLHRDSNSRSKSAEPVAVSAINDIPRQQTLKRPDTPEDGNAF